MEKTKHSMTTIPNEIINKLVTDRPVRIETTRRDMSVFFSFYFTKYIQYSIAPFQKEILQLLQEKQNKRIVITAFRNSAKSTLCSLVLPIWSIVGTHQMKNVVIVSQTDQKSEKLLSDIRRKLTVDKLLLHDHGTFYSSSDEWNKRTLVIPKYGARVTAVSISESVRGIRHEESRPDLIIYDDIEDVQSAKIQESRDKLWEIVNREFIPLGTKDTRHIFIGNLVHADSTMSRLKNLIENRKMTGIYREYPLIKDETIMWPGLFPDMSAIEEFKKGFPSEDDFLREYMLLTIPEGKQIILPEDIHRYEERDLLPRADFKMYLLLVDPAVSGEKTSKHDKTAINILKIYGSNETFKMYVCPNPINDWLTWPEIIDLIKKIIGSLGKGAVYRMLVEGGSTQKGLTQMLQQEGLNAEEITPQGNDKRTRLSMLKQLLRDKVAFPVSGTEELEKQLIYFGTERYDDLVDSLTLIPLAIGDIEKNLSSEVIRIPFSRPDPLKGIFRSSGEDWADKQDRKMFPSLYRRRNTTRII
jgi:phage terminase large subunit-like protein